MAVLVEYISEQGLEVAHAEAMECFAGGELPKVFAKLEKRLGRPLPEDHLEEFRRRQLGRLAVDVEPIGGAAKLLAAMTLPFVVASNAPRNKVELCMKTTGLDRFIESSRILSAYEIGIWKPEPDLFLAAADRLKVNPARCAVVEDSDFGIEAGINAGMHVFAYTRETRFADHSRVTRIDHLDELQPLLIDSQI